MLARQKRTKGAMVGHLQLTFFSRGSMSYVATYLKQQLTACFWSLLSFLKWLQCAWHLLQILYFCLTDFAVSLLTGRGSLGNREKTWHLSLSSFLPSFLTASPPSTGGCFQACWEPGEADRWNNWARLPALANRHQACTNCSVWGTNYNWRIGGGRGGAGVTCTPTCLHVENVAHWRN